MEQLLIECESCRKVFYISYAVWLINKDLQNLCQSCEEKQGIDQKIGIHQVNSQSSKHTAGTSAGVQDYE